MISTGSSVGAAWSSSSYSGLGAMSGTGRTGSGQKAERASPLEDLFAKIDQSSDGKVSTDELQSFVDEMTAQTKGALLSVQEGSGTTTTSVADSLAGADADGDGSLNESELGDWMKANAPPPPPPPPQGGEAAQSADAAGSSSGSGSSGSSGSYSPMDTNQDGTVSQAELTAYLSQASSTDGTASSSTDTSGFATLVSDLIRRAYGQARVGTSAVASTAFDAAV